MRITPLLATSALLLGPVLAQSTTTHVVPAASADSEANGTAFWACTPFDSRQQLLLDKRHLEGFAGRELVAIRIRRNTGLNVPYDGGQLAITIELSNSRATTDAPSPLFAANRGADATAVFAQSVTLPRSGGSPKTPAPWENPHAITFTLQKPFLYTGGTLCIETVTSTPRTKDATAAPWWPIDADVRPVAGTVRPYGTSCIPDMLAQPAGAEPSSLAIGATAAFYLEGTRRASPAVLTIGGQSVGLDLSFLGAAGCHIYNDWLLVMPTMMLPLPKNRAANASVLLPLPASQSLSGVSLFAQWILPDLPANRLGLSFSNGMEAKIGTPSDPDAAWIDGNGTEAVHGRVVFGRLPVLQFSFKNK